MVYGQDIQGPLWCLNFKHGVFACFCICSLFIKNRGFPAGFSAGYKTPFGSDSDSWGGTMGAGKCDQSLWDYSERGRVYQGFSG